MRRDDGNGRRALDIVRSVRNRWRLRMVLRGAAVVLGTGFVAFLLSAYGLEALRFSEAAVTGFRFAAWATVGLVALVFLVRPLLRRVSDERVALYLEEHEPSLEQAILAAVEVEKATPGEAGAGPSPKLLRRLVDRAVERAEAVEFGRRIERTGLYRSSGALAVLGLAGLVFLLYGPEGLRYGMGALLDPTTDAAAVNPYSIVVEPGDVTIARGSDQMVRAMLRGFEAEDVSLFMRSGDGAPFQRLSMIPGEGGAFELLLLAVGDELEYFVESNGIRSATHAIAVADLPYVGQLEQELRYPSYTGLPARVVEDGGDVAAVRGTVVHLRVHPTVPTGAGRLLVDDGVAMELVPEDDGTLTARFTVREAGFYAIELAGADGAMVAASPHYTIDVLTDMPPTVDVTEPGRDTPVSPIEEVYVEAEARDDYGIADLRLVYSVNGGPEDTVAIFRGGANPLPEVSGGHTLYLEEWGLEQGDVVTYWAVARDNSPAGGRREVVSDLYFLNVRPFGRDYREAPQQGGGPPQGGGGEQGPESALSELQKQVIAATFNLRRDREYMPENELSEALATTALAQGRVKEQVRTLIERMGNRGIAGADARFQEIARLLPEAVGDMERAEAALRDGKPEDALPPEQSALRVLLRAEETYERYVAEQQQQGGGGGGGQGPNAEDLADLFELELDKLRNQYETVQRGERQQADTEVDEVLERLKELARRQQQEAERQRARASQRQQQGGAGGGGSASQRELAEETEEAARQLQRLARETGDRQLEEVARNLQEAADAMRRSAAGDGNAGRAGSSEARERLDEARRRLERNREDRLQTAADDARARARRLGENQRRVQEALEDLPAEGEGRARALRDMVERKDGMLEELRALERDLDRLASESRRDSPETARELGEAAEQIRESNLEAKIAWSRGVVQQRERDFARDFEEQIAGDIAELEQRLRDASEAAGRVGEEGRLEETLERAQDLQRGAESLGRRLDPEARTEEGGEAGGDRRLDGGRRGAGEPEEGRQGQQGQQGQEGSEGGRGEEGREGGAARPGEGNREGGGQPGYSADPVGGATRGTPRPFTEEEIRQFSREFRERLEDARELRDALREDGRDTGELDRAMEAMQRLQDVRSYRDLPQVALLQEQVRESLARVEFSLRREVEGDRAAGGSISGSDDVPESYRRLVDEYYRALARERRDGGGG